MKTVKVPAHVWNTDAGSQDILIAVCKAERVVVVAEIGTCCGATTAALVNAGFKVYTCDIRDEDVAPEILNHPQVIFVLGDRDALFAKVPQDEKIDAIFIDGDHSYAALVADFKKAETRQIPLIFVHDCNGIEDVKRFCLEQAPNPYYQSIMIQTYHDSIGHSNGIAIFKRK
jgi:hypothetical protein